MCTLSSLLQSKTAFLILIFSTLSLFSKAQTTEGTEFWLSFMANEKSSPELSIMVSAKRDCKLTIVNPNTGYSATADLVAGLNKISPSLTPENESYVMSSEIVEKKSLLITSTDTIALFASNYLSKVFDVTGVLPSTALLDEYMVQTYATTSQKSEFPPEFLIVATMDSTIVDITPTWITSAGKLANVPFSITLNRGECYQVQSQSGEGSDLSGSIVKARNGKKVAVFNGNQRANIIYDGSNEGDHLFEQAMPVDYWGTKFVVTRSLNRTIDKVRITAKNNDTNIKRNGVIIATINSGQTFEFEILNPDESCYIETSCPCAVFVYLVSKHKFDTANAIGGPSMIWMNPLEQMIKEINFCTYTTPNTSNHYINLVTKTTNTADVTLTGKSSGVKALVFKPVVGNPDYSYARSTLSDDSYSLKGDAGVIAHVYGLGTDESYGYSVGGAVKSLEQFILINGEPFSPGADIKLCSKDTIHYSCNLNFDTENILWNFGDGTPAISGKNITKVDHFYPNSGKYNAYLIVQRLSSNLCQGQLARDSIAITVNIEKIDVAIDKVSDFICSKEGKFNAYYSLKSQGTIIGAEIKFGSNELSQGFTDNTLTVKNTFFEIPLPALIAPAKSYTAKIIVHGVCSNDTIPISFMVNYPAEKILAQRWNDVLAVKNSAENGGYIFTDFQWFKNDSSMLSQTRSYIYLNGAGFTNTDTYYVKLKSSLGLELCTCKKHLEDKSGDENKWLFENEIIVESTFAKVSSQVRIATPSAGIAYFRDLTGKIYSSSKIIKTLDYVTTPNKTGIYLMDVQLENGQRKTVKINVVN